MHMIILAFTVRLETDEVCPANDCEWVSDIVEGNGTSELVAFPAWFSFGKGYWTIGFVSQVSVATLEATIFEIVPYVSLQLLFALFMDVKKRSKKLNFIIRDTILLAIFLTKANDL